MKVLLRGLWRIGEAIMINNTMTLALNGDVPIKAFASAIASFNSLVEALSSELGAESVEWFVDDLAKSSAIATVRGESQIPNKVEQVVSGFAQVGRALETGTTIPYSPMVKKHAQAISGILGGHVTSIRFETAEDDITISGLNLARQSAGARPAYGAIEGRIQTLTNRSSLRFTLFDSLHDRAVSCYWEEALEHIMHEAWGKRAIVEGLIARDPITGRPTSIRSISNIHFPDDVGGDYRNARGIVSVPDGAPSPEDIIRRLRDG